MLLNRIVKQGKVQNWTVIALACLTTLGCEQENWSPQKADYIFVSNKTGNNEIYLARSADQSEINVTNHAASDNWPEWSPDGSKILFQSRRNGNLDLFVMSADGSNLVQLTDDPAHDYVGSWSPDGSKIYFLSWRMEGEETIASPHYYVMSENGGGQQRLIAESPNTSGALSPSPDGKRVVFVRRGADTGSEIIEFTLSDGRKNTLYASVQSLGAPAYSPDGKSIAFYAEDNERASIWIMDSDGSNRREVYTAMKAWYPRWSADGRWLLVTVSVSDDDSQLAIGYLPADGSGELVFLVKNDNRNAEGRWRP